MSLQPYLCMHAWRSAFVARCGSRVYQCDPCRQWRS
jgi:hypothetical protein